jgi:hypothetical protein
MEEGGRRERRENGERREKLREEGRLGKKILGLES